MPLFTKEFLRELQEKADGIDLVDFIMETDKISFDMAVLKISQYLKIPPSVHNKVRLLDEEA
jgi:hypothetical protein